MVSSFHGVINGFRGSSISLGCPKRIIAPFSLPRYFSKSSRFWYATPATGPRTAPSVLADHPPVASVKDCSAGARIRPVAGPRVQLFAMLHGSRRTLGRSEEHTSELQ